MEFLSNVLHSNVLVPGIICCLTLLIHFNKFTVKERGLVYIVLFNLTVELIASYYGFQHKFNQWVYNIASYPDFILYSTFYYRILEDKKKKKLILFVAPVLLVLQALNMTFLQGGQVINTYTAIPINIFNVAMCYMYMHQCVENYDENPFRNLIFWFSMATLIDLSGTVPVVATLNSLAFSATDVIMKLYSIIIFLYILWFSLITIGVIWTKRIMKSPSLLS